MRLPMCLQAQRGLQGDEGEACAMDDCLDTLRLLVDCAKIHAVHQIFHVGLKFAQASAPSPYFFCSSRGCPGRMPANQDLSACLFITIFSLLTHQLQAFFYDNRVKMHKIFLWKPWLA